MCPLLRSTSTKKNILECLCRVFVLKKHKNLLKFHMKTTHLFFHLLLCMHFRACVRIWATVEIMQFWFQEKLTWLRMVALELLIWFWLEQYWKRPSPGFLLCHHTLSELWKARCLQNGHNCFVPAPLATLITTGSSPSLSVTSIPFLWEMHQNSKNICSRLLGEL